MKGIDKMSVVQIIGSNGGTSSSNGGASGNQYIDNLSGQVNGSNVNFSTSNTFIGSTVQVYYNGMLQILNDGYTEDTDKGGITMLFAPETGSKIVLIYQIAS